jgi:hypothetical protein
VTVTRGKLTETKVIHTEICLWFWSWRIIPPTSLVSTNLWITRNPVQSIPLILSLNRSNKIDGNK